MLPVSFHPLLLPRFHSTRCIFCLLSPFRLSISCLLPASWKENPTQQPSQLDNSASVQRMNTDDEEARRNRFNADNEKSSSNIDEFKAQNKRNRRKSMDIAQAVGLPSEPSPLVRAALASHFLLSGASAAELDALVLVCTPTRLSPGERLFPRLEGSNQGNGTDFSKDQSSDGDGNRNSAVVARSGSGSVLAPDKLHACYVLTEGALELEGSAHNTSADAPMPPLSPLSGDSPPTVAAVASSTSPPSSTSSSPLSAGTPQQQQESAEPSAAGPTTKGEQLTPTAKCLNALGLVGGGNPPSVDQSIVDLVAASNGAVVWSLALEDFRAAMAETQLSVQRNRVEFLTGTQLFGTAPPTLLAQFAEAMEEVEFAPGSSIMTLGEPGEHLYVVTSGQVEVLDVSNTGVLASLGRGACVGEMALLQPHGKRSATVRVNSDAAHPALALSLGRAHFQALLSAPSSSSSSSSAAGAASEAEAAGSSSSSASLFVAALLREKRLRALEQVPLLSSLRRHQLEALFQGMENSSGEHEQDLRDSSDRLLRTFAPGEVVATAGDACDTLYVVHSGFVRQERRNSSSNDDGVDGGDEKAKEKIHVETLGPGDYFGADALLTGEPLGATFVAADAEDTGEASSPVVLEVSESSAVEGLTESMSALDVAAAGGSLLPVPPQGGPVTVTAVSEVPGAELLVLNRAAFQRIMGDSPAVTALLEEHLQQQQRRAVLRSVPLLNEYTGFRDKELDAVAALLRYQLFEPGEVMLEAGDLATALFILFDGEADQMDPLASPTSTSVSSPSSSGAAGVVRLPAKSFFGAEGLKGSPAPYTVVAAGTEGMPPVTCLVLERESLEGLNNPALAARLVEAAHVERFAQRAKRQARRASTTTEGAAAAAADLSANALRAELQRQASNSSLEDGAGGAAAGEASAGGGALAGSAGALSSAPKAARRLSVGQGMQAELPEDLALEDLEVLRVLGEGNYGRVKLVVHPPTGFVLALKTMHKQRIAQKKQTANVLREAAILHSVAHPFVLRCICTFQTTNQIFMLLELVQAGDLWPYIYRKKVPKFFNALARTSFGGFEVSAARFYTANVVAALEYVHSLGIAYRDLKPENLVFDGFGYLKVIDFGLSKFIPYSSAANYGKPDSSANSGKPGQPPSAPVVEKKKRFSVMSSLGLKSGSSSGSSAVTAPKNLKSFTMCGTTEYLAPEAVTGRGHDKSIDLWALGCLLYELLVGRTPFRGRNNEQTLERIVNSKEHLAANPFLCEGNRDAASLIRGLLEPNPATRLGNGAKGWSAITSHPFFTQPQPLGSGGGKGGVGDGKEGGDGKEEGGGDWVDPIDWDRLVTRQVPAPFKPEVSDALDVSGFEDNDDDPNAPENVPPYKGFDVKAFADFGSSAARDSSFSSIPSHPSAKLAALT